MEDKLIVSLLMRDIIITFVTHFWVIVRDGLMQFHLGKLQQYPGI